MTDKELMQQALEALESLFNGQVDAERGQRCASAATALRERLAQPEQEPVAWMHPDWRTYTRAPAVSITLKEGWHPLYTTPPQRKPLTDEQIAEALGFGEHTTATTRAILTHAARAIEAKIKENT